MRQSDHRPVYSIFQATVKLIQLDKKRSLKAEIVKQLETQRQEYLPKVKVSPLEFEFSNVLYKVQQEKTLFIMNIGKTVCVFNILYDKVFTWLSFSQLTGSIHPGETLEIQIKVLFKEKEAQKANYICKYRTASPKLRFIDGIEENLMVRSDFAGSCFGCNFKELAKILGPISNLKGNIKENADKTEGITTVPKELFRIVEFIKASEVSGELERLCDFDTIAEIRSNLDCFEPFSNKANWNAMVLVLIEMLEAMPSPLISPIIFDEIIKETPIGPGSLLRAAIYAKVDLITLKSFEYLMDLLKWLCEKNHKLLEFITENFMYSIFHIKRTKNSTVITDYTRRQFFINMVIS